MGGDAETAYNELDYSTMSWTLCRASRLDAETRPKLALRLELGILLLNSLSFSDF